MANYTAAQMTAGALGEVLNAGQQYEFTLTTPAYTSQSVYFGAATFMTDSSTFTNANLQGSSTNPIVGALEEGAIPLSNVVAGITVNGTFLFDVVGDLQGSSAQISLTSTAGVITSALVVRGGRDFTSGDGITISQNDLQAAGFANADASQQIDVFPDHIRGEYVSSNMTGSFGGVGATGVILSGLNLRSSATGGTGGTVATLLNQAPSSQTGGGSLATFDLVVDLSGGVISPAQTLAGTPTGGEDGTPGVYTGVATTSPNGESLTLDVTTITTGVFKAAQSFDTFTTVNAAKDGVTGALATTSATGVGATVVITALAGVVSQVVISAQGSGYVVAETLTVSQAAMDADGAIGVVDADLVITIAPKDLGSSVQTVVSADAGTLYEVGDVITVARELIGGTTTNLTIGVRPADLTPTLASITIGDNNGSGYDVGDQLTFSGAASPGGATAIVLTLIDQFFTSGPTLGWIISNRGFAFTLPQSVGAAVVAFNFTPTTLIPANSYLIKSTGHFTLNIT